MGTWLHFAAKNTTGRMLAIWFPVMIFVLNGFQHLVANMFVIPQVFWQAQTSLGDNFSSI